MIVVPHAPRRGPNAVERGGRAGGRGPTAARRGPGGGPVLHHRSRKNLLRSCGHERIIPVAMKNDLVLTRDLRIKFVDVYRQCGLLNRSAAAIAVSPGTVRAARKEDSDFDAAVKQAYEDFRESLEAEAFRRAVSGWDEEVFQKGECVGTRHVCSDRILELMLKRHIPEYRERQSMDVTVAGGVLVVPGTKETMDDWERRNRGSGAADAASGGQKLLP